MEQIKAMASAQAAKAFVASFLAAFAAATVALPDGFTPSEILTILTALFLTFQATYWTNNAKAYAGSIDVQKEVDGTKTFLLNLDSDPADLDQKSDVTFKING